MFKLDAICPSISGEHVRAGWGGDRAEGESVYMTFALKRSDFRIEIRGWGVDIEIEGNALGKGPFPGPTDTAVELLNCRAVELLSCRAVELLRGRDVEPFRAHSSLSSIANAALNDTSAVRLLFAKVTDWSQLDCPYTTALGVSGQLDSVCSVREIIESISLCDFFRNSNFIEANLAKFPLDSEEIDALKKLVSACKANDPRSERKRIIEVYRELKAKRRDRILGLRFPKKSIVAKLKKRINGRFVKNNTETNSETF